LSGNLFTGHVEGGHVFLEDCSIAKPLSDVNAKNISFDILSSSVDSISGTGVSVLARSSRIQASEEVLLNGASMTAVDCHIISDTGAIVGASSSLVAQESNLSEASSSTGILFASNSAYNGDVFELYISRPNAVIKDVLGARDGDTKASKVEIKLSSSGEYANVSNARILYNGTDTSITVYMIFSTEEIRLKAKPTLSLISDGLLKNIAPTSFESDDGAWAAYDGSVVKMRAIFDISGYSNIPVNSRIKASLSISDGPAGGGFAVVDSNIIGA